MKIHVFNKSLFLIALFWATSVRSEYRVYQYYVKPAYPTVREISPYLVTTTLDPVSYTAYNGGSKSIKVDLVRTWMCKGFTGGGKPICPSPLDKMKKEAGSEN